MPNDWNIVKPTPLPEDNQNVEWVNTDGDQKTGKYHEQDEVFFTEDGYFDFAFNVEKWRALPFVILAAIVAYIYLT